MIRTLGVSLLLVYILIGWTVGIRTTWLHGLLVLGLVFTLVGRFTPRRRNFNLKMSKKWRNKAVVNDWVIPISGPNEDQREGNY